MSRQEATYKLVRLAVIASVVAAAGIPCAGYLVVGTIAAARRLESQRDSIYEAVVRYALETGKLAPWTSHEDTVVVLYTDEQGPDDALMKRLSDVRPRVLTTGGLRAGSPGVGFTLGNLRLLSAAEAELDWAYGAKMGGIADMKWGTARAARKSGRWEAREWSLRATT